MQRLLGPLLLRVASAAAGSVVTASSLDFNLWTGHVHATGLRFIRPGLDITSASLDVQVRPRRGFVVRAIEPRVVVSLAADAAPAPPNLRPWTVLDRFAAIDIVRGALRVQGDGGSHALQIDGIEAHATRAGGKLAATVVATSDRLQSARVRVAAGDGCAHRHRAAGHDRTPFTSARRGSSWARAS